MCTENRPARDPSVTPSSTSPSAIGAVLGRLSRPGPARAAVGVVRNCPTRSPPANHPTAKVLRGSGPGTPRQPGRSGASGPATETLSSQAARARRGGDSPRMSFPVRRSLSPEGCAASGYRHPRADTTTWTALTDRAGAQPFPQLADARTLRLTSSSIRKAQTARVCRAVLQKEGGTVGHRYRDTCVLLCAQLA